LDLLAYFFGRVRQGSHEPRGEMKTSAKTHSAGFVINRSLLAALIHTATLALRTFARPVPLNGEMPVPLDHLRFGNPISNL
jgi:hypothetical protein